MCEIAAYATTELITCEEMWFRESLKKYKQEHQRNTTCNIGKIMADVSDSTRFHQSTHPAQTLLKAYKADLLGKSVEMY